MDRIPRILRTHPRGPAVLAAIEAALQAVDPADAVRRYLSRSDNRLTVGDRTVNLNEFDRIVLLAAGKAAVPMVCAASEIVREKITHAVAITKYGYSGDRDTAKVHSLELFEAAHPIPDEAGLRAGEYVHELLAECDERNLLLCLISGGCSSLLTLPTRGILLEDLQTTTDLLLRAGADIYELNAVRKHLTAITAGRLAELVHPAWVESLILSDVIGDPLDVVGAGPTAPDSTTFADALTVLKKYFLIDRVPIAVVEHLRKGHQGMVLETPKVGDPVFERVHNQLVGNNRVAVDAAAAALTAHGIDAHAVPEPVLGEARTAARQLIEQARRARPAGPSGPFALVFGGETTVTVTGKGKGGRNQELALAAALELEQATDCLVASLGTDGTDGPTEAAGAVCDGTTVARAEKLAINSRELLTNNDSHGFFEQLDDLIITGPTGTNVADVMIVVLS